MSCRGLSMASRCSGNAVRVSGRGFPVQLRTFSNSATHQKHGAVPTFTKVSSPELQDHLTKIRERIFLPAHISKEQRSLMMKTKHAMSLETEPVTVTIAGEDFRLKHLNPKTDIPGSKKSLYTAVRLMQERDWENLPNLLQGLRQAGFRLQDNEANWVVRKAGRAGRQDVILECLRRGDETGMRLANPSVVNNVFSWIQRKAMTNSWDTEDTKKALRWAEMVTEMLEDPNYRAQGDIKSLVDLPGVTGILLELAAVRALKHQNGKDADGKVEKYALDLLAVPRHFTPKQGSSAILCNWLFKHVATAHGMKLAQTVLGPTSEISHKLKERSELLEPLLLNAKDQLSTLRNKKGETLNCVLFYEQLLGPEAV